jgi:hypothetical protein
MDGDIRKMLARSKYKNSLWKRAEELERKPYKVQTVMVDQTFGAASHGPNGSGGPGGPNGPPKQSCASQQQHKKLRLQST